MTSGTALLSKINSTLLSHLYLDIHSPTLENDMVKALSIFLGNDSENKRHYEQIKERVRKMKGRLEWENVPNKFLSVFAELRKKIQNQN